MSDTKPKTPQAPAIPAEDGITHINVYSKGKTALGRNLSNFAHIPIEHPEHGFFASMEAYWYWLSTGMIHEDLRRLYGASAKTAGIRHMPVKMDTEQFHTLVCDGLRLKVAQNRQLREALKKTTLPLRHYFVYGDNPPVVRENNRHLYQMECLEALRENLQKGEPILLSTGKPAQTVEIPEVVENPIPQELRMDN